MDPYTVSVAVRRNQGGRRSMINMGMLAREGLVHIGEEGEHRARLRSSAKTAPAEQDSIGGRHAEEEEYRGSVFHHFHADHCGYGTRVWCRTDC